MRRVSPWVAAGTGACVWLVLVALCTCILFANEHRSTGSVLVIAAPVWAPSPAEGTHGFEAVYTARIAGIGSPGLPATARLDGAAAVVCAPLPLPDVSATWHPSDASDVLFLAYTRTRVPGIAWASAQGGPCTDALAATEALRRTRFAWRSHSEVAADAVLRADAVLGFGAASPLWARWPRGDLFLGGGEDAPGDVSRGTSAMWGGWVRFGGYDRYLSGASAGCVRLFCDARGTSAGLCAVNGTWGGVRAVLILDPFIEHAEVAAVLTSITPSAPFVPAVGLPIALFGLSSTLETHGVRWHRMRSANASAWGLPVLRVGLRALGNALRWNAHTNITRVCTVPSPHTWTQFMAFVVVCSVVLLSVWYLHADTLLSTREYHARTSDASKPQWCIAHMHNVGPLDSSIFVMELAVAVCATAAAWSSRYGARLNSRLRLFQAFQAHVSAADASLVALGVTALAGLEVVYVMHAMACQSMQSAIQRIRQARVEPLAAQPKHRAYAHRSITRQAATRTERRAIPASTWAAWKAVQAVVPAARALPDIPRPWWWPACLAGIIPPGWDAQYIAWHVRQGHNSALAAHVSGERPPALPPLLFLRRTAFEGLVVVSAWFALLEGPPQSMRQIALLPLGIFLLYARMVDMTRLMATAVVDGVHPITALGGIAGIVLCTVFAVDLCLRPLVAWQFGVYGAGVVGIATAALALAVCAIALAGRWGAYVWPPWLAQRTRAALVRHK